MRSLDAVSLPCPQLSITEALAHLAPEDEHEPAPVRAQVRQPMFPEHQVPPPAGEAYPQRVPGTHQHPGLQPRPSYTPYAPGLLDQVREGLLHLDDIETGCPEGFARGLLADALWQARRYYEGMDLDTCGDCRADGLLCDFHAPRLVLALTYEDLQKRVTAAASDGAALLCVAAAIRSGSADRKDIAPFGSPLEPLLLAALDRVDAIGGVSWR